jgi:hypothetical protein
MIFRLFPIIKITLFWLLLAITAEFNHFAAADSAQDSTVIAALALNFARFTEWPASAINKSDATLQLCVLGDNVIQQAFDEVDKKQVGDRVLNVINMSRIKNVGQCHLLYVSALDRNTTIQLLAETSRQHTLTIGGDEKHFLEDGGMVALIIVEGKVNIQINLNAVKQAGLQISSRVLKLATIVNH